MIAVLTVVGLVFLGLSAFGINFPRVNSLGAGLFCICLAQYGPQLLAHVH